VIALVGDEQRLRGKRGGECEWEEKGGFEHGEG
jgi:hypothetical protein